MIYNDQKKIEKYLRNFRNDNEYMHRREIWDKDFDLWKLKPYDAGQGYYSYTSNSPRVLVERVVAILASAKMKARVPLETLLEESERVTASNNEYLFYGARKKQDMRNLMLGMPTTQELRAWYGCMRGGYVSRPYVYKNEKDETTLEEGTFDIYNFAYGVGEYGVDWGIIWGNKTRDQILAEFNFDIHAKEAEVLEAWDTQGFSVMVMGKGKQWLLEPQEHDLDYCPLFVIKVGACPPNISHYSDVYSSSYSGYSLLSQNRDIYPLLNKTLSDMLTVVRRGVKPPIGVWSPGGSETLDEDIWQVAKGSATPFDVNTSVKPILEPTMPTDARSLVEIVMSEQQRGGLPHTSLGQLGFRLSGFAVNQLNATIESLIQPFVASLAHGDEIDAHEIISQFGKSKLSSVNVRGRDSRGYAFGYPAAKELKPSDVNTDWELEVRLLPELPKDDAQKIQIAALAKKAGLMSDIGILDNILEVDDPEAERQMITKEWADNLPLIRLQDMMRSYLAQKDFAKAQQVLMEIQRLVLSMSVEQAQKERAIAGLSGNELGSMENSGAGMPVRETGMSPEVYPAESEGGFPPGAETAGGAF